MTTRSLPKRARAAARATPDSLDHRFDALYDRLCERAEALGDPKLDKLRVDLGRWVDDCSSPSGAVAAPAEAETPLSQARGIVDTLAGAASHRATPPDESLARTLTAVLDLLDEAAGAIWPRHPEESQS